jgi:hypothetical protein
MRSRRLLRPHYSFPKYGLGNRSVRVMQPLKLLALDQDDLHIVAAHLQDAVIKVADVHWWPSERRLILVFNRFDWEQAYSDEPKYQRRRSALRFERVAACKACKITPTNKDAVLNLLNIEFAEEDLPAGCITLTFSGGIAMRLQVECIEVELVDLGPVWQAACPQHLDDAPAA